MFFIHLVMALRGIRYSLTLFLVCVYVLGFVSVVAHCAHNKT